MALATAVNVPANQVNGNQVISAPTTWTAKCVFIRAIAWMTAEEQVITTACGGSYGAADYRGNQFAYSYRATTGEPEPNGVRTGRSDRCINAILSNNVTVFGASIVSVGNDGANTSCTINWTNAPDVPMRVEAVFFDDEDIEVKIAPLGTSTSDVPHTTQSPVDSMLLFCDGGTLATGNANVSAFYIDAVGAVSNLQTAPAQFSMGCALRNGISNTQIRRYMLQVGSQQVLATGGAPATSWQCTIKNLTPGPGFITNTDNSGGNDDVGTICFTHRAGLSSDATTRALPGSTGLDSYSTGWQPCAVLTTVSGLLALSIPSQDGGASYEAVSMATAGREWNVNWRTTYNAPSMVNATETTAGGLKVVDGNAALEYQADPLVFTATGWERNFTAVSSGTPKLSLTWALQSDPLSETVTVENPADETEEFLPAQLDQNSATVQVRGTTTGTEGDIQVRVVEEGTLTPITSYATGASGTGGNWTITLDNIPKGTKDQGYLIQARDGTDDNSLVTSTSPFYVGVIAIGFGNSIMGQMNTKTDPATPYARQHKVLFDFFNGGSGLNGLSPDNIGNTALADELANELDTPVLFLNAGVGGQPFFRASESAELGSALVATTNYEPGNTYDTLFQKVNAFSGASVERAYLTSFISDASRAHASRNDLITGLTEFLTQLNTDYSNVRTGDPIKLYMLDLGDNEQIPSNFSSVYSETRAGMIEAVQAVTDVEWGTSSTDSEYDSSDEPHWVEYITQGLRWNVSDPPFIASWAIFSPTQTDVTCTLQGAATVLTTNSSDMFQVLLGDNHTATWQPASVLLQAVNVLRLNHAPGTVQAVRYAYGANLPNRNVVTANTAPYAQPLAPYLDIGPPLGSTQADLAAAQPQQTSLRRPASLVDVPDTGKQISFSFDIYWDPSVPPANGQYLWHSDDYGGFNSATSQVLLTGTEQFQMDLRDNTDTVVVRIRGNPTMVAGQWYRVRISADTATSSASLWVDDDEQSTPLTLVPNGDIVFAQGGSGLAQQYHIFSRNGSDGCPCRLADFRVYMGTAVDWSAQATRENPPTAGAQIWHAGNAEQFVYNRGSSGGFALWRGPGWTSQPPPDFAPVVGPDFKLRMVI